MARDGRDDALDRFIVESNVSNFFERLDTEQEPGKCAVLSDILRAEACMYCHLVGNIEKLEFYLGCCHAHITRCELLISAADSSDKKQLRKFLQNMIEVRQTLQSVQALRCEQPNPSDRP